MEVLEIPGKQEKVLTVKEIASQDVRKAAVFKRFGIEICCAGIMSLETACLNLKLDLAEVQNELKKAISDEKKSPALDLENASPERLIDYVYNNHHVPFYKENNVILDLLSRVQSHTKQYPVLKEVNKLYLELQKNLINHFSRKENGIFTEIKKAIKLKRYANDEVPQGLADILEEIETMRAVHQETLGMLQNLRNVANNFITPEVACNSFKLLYHKLKGFEEDLLTYIHVEDKILFPKVVLLSGQLQTQK